MLLFVEDLAREEYVYINVKQITRIKRLGDNFTVRFSDGEFITVKEHSFHLIEELMS
jgi:hypothetical protein